MGRRRQEKQQVQLHYLFICIVSVLFTAPQPGARERGTPPGAEELAGQLLHGGHLRGQPVPQRQGTGRHHAPHQLPPHSPGALDVTWVFGDAVIVQVAVDHLPLWWSTSPVDPP